MVHFFRFGGHRKMYFLSFIFENIICVVAPTVPMFVFSSGVSVGYEVCGGTIPGGVSIGYEICSGTIYEGSCGIPRKEQWVLLGGLHWAKEGRFWLVIEL